MQIDHILPWSTTRDNSVANLALAFTSANQDKAKQSPFDAFGSGYRGQDYEHILARAKKRGGGVYWRFKEDAMERYRIQEEFESRFLNDTRYIARMAARYLSCVCADPSGVVSLNGRITSDLRRVWGLNAVVREIMVEEGRLDAADFEFPEDGETLDEIRSRRKRADKVRWDHRHHLLDAIVAACTTRSDVQRLQTLAARDTGHESASEILAQVRRAGTDFKNAGVCWRIEFRETVKAFLEGQGRDSAAGKLPVTSVVVKADHDPRGQLHKATNYGLICEMPGKPGQYVARNHVSISEGLDAKQIKALGVPETAIRAVERAKEQGARFWWGGHDPVTSLRNNLARDLAEMRTSLLKLMKEAPPEVLKDVRTEGDREKARAKWAKREYIGHTGRRRFTKVQIVSLRILKGPLKHDKKPRQANPTGGNDRLIYFVNGEGKRDIEVVSTLKANTPGFRERWRREGGRLLFVLRRNDSVEMVADPKDPASPRRLYRTVSFSNTGQPDLKFVPIEEARSGRPPKHVRIRSVRTFSERVPVLVLCDPTGRVCWRGPRLN